MGIQLRMPSIKGAALEQLAQIRSYLYQIIPQIEWALNHIDPSAITGYMTNESKMSESDHSSREVVGTWVNLGFSKDVEPPASNCGRWDGDGCYCRVRPGERHIYIAFNCSIAHGMEALQINEKPIPAAYRPKRSIYSLCSAGGKSVAQVHINNEGNVFVDWIHPITTGEESTTPTVGWIDGYIDYWT